MERFFETFKDQLNIQKVDVKRYSPLTLAYIGDSIYDCMVKLFLVSGGNRSVNQLHRESKTYVKASEQALRLDALMPSLTEREQQIVKWGRNAKSQTIPKHATKSDYQKATAYECLLGYLLMDGDYERLLECIVEGIKYGETDTAID